MLSSGNNQQVILYTTEEIINYRSCSSYPHAIKGKKVGTK